jgi:hypothetical protein
MSYTNGINGHRAFPVKFKDVNYYSDKMISLDQSKSKTFLKNNYKYIKFQGKYYTVKPSRSYVGSATLVWFSEEATILLLNKKEINTLADFYNENDENQHKLMPDFSNAPINNEFKKILSTYCENIMMPFTNTGFLMSELVNTILTPNWNNLKRKNPIQSFTPPTIKSVLSDC